MIYTVFSYIPLLEEETAHKKTELVKNNNNDTEGPGSDSDNESETEPSPEILFEKPLNLNLSGITASQKHFAGCCLDYDFRLNSCSTPPPKISA